MKKLTTLCLASLSLLTLMACSKQETTNSPSQTVTSASSTKSSQTSSSSSTEKKSSSSSSEETKNSSSQKTVTETSSDQATEAKKETETETESQTQIEETAQPLPTNEDLYASTLYLVGADNSPGAATHYAFYDVDGNGSPELITAWNHGGYLRPAAIYYLQNGVPAYLARDYVAGGGGRRETFTIYTDGTVEWDEWSSGSGGGTAYLYQLAGDNSGYWIVGQQDFNQRELPNPEYVNQFGGGRGVLDMGSLIWNAF